MEVGPASAVPPYGHTACCIACGCNACALRRCRVPAGACLASRRSVSWRSQVCGDIACGGRTGPLDCGYQKDVFSVPVIINMHTEMLPIEIGRGDALSKSGVELYTTQGILQTRFAVVSRCVCGSMNVPAVGGVARLCASLCTAWWGAVNGPREPPCASAGWWCRKGGQPTILPRMLCVVSAAWLASRVRQHVWSLLPGACYRQVSRVHRHGEDGEGQPVAHPGPRQHERCAVDFSRLPPVARVLRVCWSVTRSRVVPGRNICEQRED